MIPSGVTILNNELPDAPGVYFYYSTAGKLLYVGKATSLKKRVGSYFVKAHDARIADLVRNIARIDYIQVPTVIEALVLEANQIKKHQPPYNIMQRDDKSFLYLCITNEKFPKPVLLRGLDLERLGIKPFSRTLPLSARKRFLAVYGPYLSGRSLKTALELVRKSIPWSTCESPPSLREERDPTTPNPSSGRRGGARPCFDAQIGRCPGVCTGAISKTEYRKIIRQLMLFFAGKKEKIVRTMTKEMNTAVKAKQFERAAKLRDKIFALEHIQDVSLIVREEVGGGQERSGEVDQKNYINVDGRIEAYDIANISGTSNVASMVVFEGGKPNKDQYRRFRIKTFEGANDVAAMEEVIRRRVVRNLRTPDAWPLPDIMVIDGGEGQVNRVQQVLDELGVKIPIIGIAKGFDRKQDRLVYNVKNADLRRVAEGCKEVLQKARDEAHRFAGSYHRLLRSKRSGIPRPKRLSRPSLREDK
ncbi:MAG: UvrB/UvrC motif-containing protein [Candidatus Uhrbacteria bacterium]|nr:UvrB/UvrC motif-containing protein [Candidatus Uhrbacteria bacterium]